jgi:hypothetical protein
MTNDSDPTGGGLVSLEGLTKPATVLIEKISDAIGTLYRPRQIVREARAEAEAEKIKALAGFLGPKNLSRTRAMFTSKSG